MQPKSRRKWIKADQNSSPLSKLGRVVKGKTLLKPICDEILVSEMNDARIFSENMFRESFRIFRGARSLLRLFRVSAISGSLISVTFINQNRCLSFRSLVM